MHRWILLALLVAAAHCKDTDPSDTTPDNTVTSQGGTTDAPLTSGAAEGGTSVASGGTDATSSPGTTEVIVPGTDTSAGEVTSDPTLPDPSAGPDPTETAFIQPMTDEGGDPSSPSDPSGGSEYGQCGWNSGAGYYDCAYNGATPGASDPNDQVPIACAGGLMANAPCDEQNGPVGNVGCCEPDGTLYYCTSQGSVIVQEECG